MDNEVTATTEDTDNKDIKDNTETESQSGNLNLLLISQIYKTYLSGEPAQAQGRICFHELCNKCRIVRIYFIFSKLRRTWRHLVNKKTKKENILD